MILIKKHLFGKVTGYKEIPTFLATIFTISSTGIIFALFLPFYEGDISYQLILIVGLIYTISFLGIITITIIYNKTFKKIKNLKENNNSNLKRLHVTSIGSFRIIEGKRFITGYYFELKDGDMTYFSEGFENAVYDPGVPMEKLEEIYNLYGFDYDENYKENVIRKIDEEIEENKNNAKDSWFFIKWFNKIFNLMPLELKRTEVETGYQPRKLFIDEKEINIGDIFDIYIDPNDPAIYYVDIDCKKR